MPPNKEEDSSSVGSKSVASKSVGIRLFQGLAYEHSLAPYYGDQKAAPKVAPSARTTCSPAISATTQSKTSRKGTFSRAKDASKNVQRQVVRLGRYSHDYPDKLVVHINSLPTGTGEAHIPSRIPCGRESVSFLFVSWFHGGETWKVIAELVRVCLRGSCAWFHRRFGFSLDGSH